MKSPARHMPTVATQNMINAAYMLIETMPQGTAERHKRIVAAVWETMAQFAPPPKAGGLTRLQAQTHEIIADYIADHGMSPTYREIGDQMGKGPSDICQIVHALKRRGVITLRGQSKRSIRLVVNPGEPLPKKEQGK